jgi:Ran GTPase-activating protein (RanGAP) involved in mRNA processing and transport
LEVAGCELGSVAIEMLAKAPALAKLRQLDLSRNRIRPRGIEALSASTHAGNLMELRLAGTQIGTQGLDALTRSKKLVSLRRLDLRGNSLAGKVVVDLLRKWPLASQLTEIRLERNSFSHGEACQLHDIFGKRLRAALY